ncbi:MAG: ArsR/SmtB family transcription factor [Candidatus Geothermarchaeales archaeon]
MSEEWRDELEKMKKEVADLRRELGERHREPRGRPYMWDLGERIGEHVNHMVEGVMEGIDAEIGRSVMIGPKGVRIYKGRKRRKVHTDPKVMAEVASALANEHRLEILSQLMRGGRYISELQEKLSEIAASTLSSHLDILEEAGLVAQERARGRYLVTIPGRIALKLMRQITRLLK